ncbi:cation acetate symporter [Thermomicrobium sp. 4228-Ro]|uniref:sodium:solute symporter family protein n=1 Tax=Thermomicrobium sp. 4228-Ro TaxID=2993937 RepID=UPI00224941C9|nr:sodium:solute symporter family protein [Thermomicrobium sp. 4228-Ro]MCX2727616.1 cation acetate symporter [Thermomicrobium sp. 4228-Ro]
MAQEAGYTPLTRAQLSEFRRRLARYYGAFFVFLIAFILVLYLLERAGLPHRFIGYAFIFLTLALYAFIGILNFTRRLEEYYVAGRRVPAIFNGMATGADWMSAASFISMAGTLWLLGYDGLAYIMGWTGGYVLLALLFAPYIRKFGQYTIPDFVATRYGERARLARLVAAICAIIVSLAYVTAQVTGVGIIMSRFFGLDYRIGVFVGLAGVLVCSFLGGMKSITWTQVAQYLILIVAYLIPVTFLSAKLTGVPFPQLMYGKALSEITQLEQAMNLSSYVQPFKQALSNASAITAFKQIGLTPPQPITVKDWVGTPWQFLALTLCLMAGTAGLPHILIRYYTVPSPKEARMSVGWSLFFIWLLYVTAPAYAAFSRWEVLQNVVGQPINALPAWTASWIKTGLLKITDANNDGILQFSELSINGDIVVLATPEIAGLPFTIAALVAAGGLAAALSTADGLLLVISTAVAHDIYAKIINPNAPYGRRFLLSRIMILVSAVTAALLAIPQFALIVQLVAWAFSLAASTFFPVVLLGIFWKRANANGAIAGMVGGLITCIVYMVWNYVDPRFNVLGLSHLSAGIFGMLANFLLLIIVSLATAPAPKYIQDMVDQLRIPVGEMRLPAPGPAPGTAPGVAPAGQD